ncbi:hypothetical protein H5410_033249 [Solanum commersonii]|uniref:Uncharacterized protein n=1 Tax=Solanum commersonii TaxID=4109 RepID=A0A9J5YQ67_SOLCO|nr:hypothetical protein H5410_033249 [Solanum commersonii]
MVKQQPSVMISNYEAFFGQIQRPSDSLNSGLRADVFTEVIQSLPYALPYEFIPFQIPNFPTSPDLDDHAYKLFSKVLKYLILVRISLFN